MAIDISATSTRIASLVPVRVTATPSVRVPPVDAIDEDRRAREYFSKAAIVSLSPESRRLAASTDPGTAEPAATRIDWNAGGETVGANSTEQAAVHIDWNGDGETAGTDPAEQAAVHIDWNGDGETAGTNPAEQAATRIDWNADGQPLFENLPGQPSGDQDGTSKSTSPSDQESAGAGDAATPSGTPGNQELSEDEADDVSRLRARDQEVRAHESAHAAVGGGMAGAPSYTFEVGPDGKRYAVAGEVPIQVAVVANSPEATIQKMQQVQRAALAPAEPSGKDRQVAAKAAALEYRARAQLTEASGSPSSDAGQTRWTLESAPGAREELHAGRSVLASPEEPGPRTTPGG